MKHDMTQGNPGKLILGFAAPMLLGNIFQQLYNVVDTIVVGRFVSYNALAAVGSAFAIMTFVNSIIIGLCMGASVLFSHQFGAKKTDQLERSISTSFIFILLFSVALSSVTLILIDPIIRLYQMPPETVDYGRDYLFYLFIGIIFTGVYNFFAFLLRSIGDSRTPLMFLLLASIINTVLDLLFVLAFNMEVRGVAIATLIAQMVSAIACMIFSIHKLRKNNIRVNRLVFDRSQFKTILEYSVLTSIQQSIMNFGILLVQGLVNTFGAVTTAAFAAGVKIDAFAYMPLQDFGNAVSTYVAQNHGSGNQKRIQQGIRFSVKAITLFSILLTALTLLFAPSLIRLFVGNEPQVIGLGASYLRTEGTFYLFIGYLFMFYGYFRGIGKPRVSVLLTIISLGCRVLLAYGLARNIGFSSISFSIVIGWLLADLTGILLYRKLNKMPLK